MRALIFAIAVSWFVAEAVVTVTTALLAPVADRLPSDADSCCGPTWECESCEVGQ